MDRFMNLHDDIAKDLSKYNGLRCKKCGNTKKVTQYDFSYYLKKGWPNCCGQIMALTKEDSP